MTSPYTLPAPIAPHCQVQSIGPSGSLILHYDDGQVFGALEVGQNEGLRWLTINEWSSRDPGLGHADRALRALRPHFDVIAANGIGEIDHDGPDISVVYWQRQHEKGLVDQLMLDDGTRLDMGPPGRLTLVRGHQGSGKSTLASQKVAEQPGLRHIEQDQFLARDGNYAYDLVRHAAAKAWCLKAVEAALDAGHDVIVSNTFTTLAELEPYLALPSSSVQVVEMFHDFPNTHSVPDAIVQAKKAQFEPCPGAVQIGRRPAPRAPR